VAADQGGGLRGHERTIVDVENFDGEWQGRIEGVTIDGEALRLRLSNEQLLAIHRMMEAIKKERRSDRGTNAAATRKLRETRYQSLSDDDRRRVNELASELSAEYGDISPYQATQRAMAILADELTHDKLGRKFES
jgi:hypothetical protein